MPTAIANMPTGQRPTALAMMDDLLTDAMAELNWQIEMALVVELAKLPPGDRRLFRAELYPINSRFEDTTEPSNLQRMVLKTWLVQRGSPEDDMTDEQACLLIKAGAAQCRFMGDDPDQPCSVDLCDHCHPEAWL